MKDTLGKDLKRDIHEKIKCTVSEYEQHKEVEVLSVVNISDYKTGKLIKSYAFDGADVFRHTYYELDGDGRALDDDEEFKNKKNIKEMDFPTDTEMINTTLTDLKAKIEDKLEIEFNRLIQ